ncbi:MAG TPA: carbohydrate porin [Candidatus Acidoferrum sp.]|jgi:porin|nr:carbohydrate porin [Candidatus Acidoferrum sp.]
MPNALKVTMGLAGLFAVSAASAQAQTDVSAASQSATNAPTTLTKKITSLMDQQYLLGDWGGERTRLADHGITFDLNDIGDFQSNVGGSEQHRYIYFGRFRASGDVDLNKLANFDGEFFISAICQYGQNLSADYLHVNTLTSSIAGVQSERLDQFWYQMGLFKDLFKIKIGQVVAVDEFGATDFFDLLFNDELGYAPNALFYARQPFSPAGKPGVILKTDLSAITPGLYAKGGIFSAYDNPYVPDGWGINYNDQFSHGYVGSFELGYQEQHTQYAGVYKIGVNANNLAAYEDLNTGKPVSGDYTAYALAEKTVYHPTDAEGQLETKKGLDMLLEFVQAPDDRNPLEYEVTAGARYTGLIPGRDQDKIGVGFIYSENSRSSSAAYRAVNGRGLGGETTVEFDYQYNPAPWLTLQLDNQVIVDPGGDDTRSAIAIIGFRTILRF